MLNIWECPGLRQVNPTTYRVGDKIVHYEMLGAELRSYKGGIIWDDMVNCRFEKFQLNVTTRPKHVYVNSIPNIWGRLILHDGMLTIDEVDYLPEQWELLIQNAKLPERVIEFAALLQWCRHTLDCVSRLP